MRWQESIRPRRLSETAPAGSPLARALNSARDRQPSLEEMRALEDGLFAALGVGVLAATAGLTTKSGAPTAMSALSSVAVKATLVVALGTGGALLGGRALRPAPRVTPPPAAVRASATPPARASAMPPAPFVEEAIPTAPAPFEQPRRLSHHRPPERRESQPTSAPRSPSLPAELRLIEDARAALSHEPARALQLCEAHRRTYASGVMAEERDAITITALLALDRLPDARAALDLFRQRYPASPQTARLVDAMTRPARSIH
ncbi:MAG TPA: hypothetical protein VHU40_19000 [Polyangia bacterium]|jgi:hypothetical protein|nr:hypothetical protein [Polyangia bacterium]